MAHPPESRDAVRRAYISDRQPLEEAARLAGIPAGTARKWKIAAEASGDDWDKARAVHALTAAGTASVAQLVLHDFLILHQATVEALKSDMELSPLQKAEAMARLSDSFTKTMAAVAKAAPELGRYAVATELLQDLADFVAERFPDHRAALVDILEPFAAFMARKYG